MVAPGCPAGATGGFNVENKPFRSGPEGHFPPRLRGGKSFAPCANHPPNRRFRPFACHCPPSAPPHSPAAARSAMRPAVRRLSADSLSTVSSAACQ